MKICIWVVLIFAALRLGAQPWTNSATGEIYTNLITDRDGYVTNRDYMTPFDVTNADGAVSTNAVMVKLEGNRFFYNSPDGVEHVGKWAMISPAMQGDAE